MIIITLSAAGIVSGFSIGLVRRGIMKRLSVHVTSLKSITFDLTGSSEQLGTISRDVGAASQEQLDSLMSTISASHEIRSMIEATSENSRKLTVEASVLKQMATSGHQAVQDMVSSSQAIRSGTDRFHSEMQDSITQLTDALKVIQEIAQKTEVINEIVFQTKLLSFNASVEAARAGEAGRGFAVVAEEVGKLAQMSGNAANEISSIVERSVSVVQTAVHTTREKIEQLTTETAKTSEAGYGQARSCEKIFGEMSAKIGETAQMIEQISTATAEQAAGVHQLDDSISRLKEVAERNQLVASQSTQHASEFETQAKKLGIVLKTMVEACGKRCKDISTMRQFVWSDRLLLGVGKMDDEHKILVGKINALVNALENPAKFQRSEIVAIFDDLASYTSEHFADEERFMDSIGYAQVASHKRIHEKLLQQVGQYGNELRAGKLQEDKLISFLRNWLISHIMGVDMQYAKHYRSGNGAQKHAA